MQRPVEPDLRRRFAALGERRAEADEPPVVVGLGEGDPVAVEDCVRVGRQFAGKHSRFGDAVEYLAADRLAFFGHADDGVERLAAGPDLSLAGGADRGERNDVDLRPDPFGARDRFSGERAQDRLQPVMARMVQMVGLCRREQDAVDAGAEDRGEPRGSSGAEGAHDVGERILEIGDRGRAGVERRKGVDQNDLPVEPGEMIAKERPHHMRLIGFVAASHHRRERAGNERRLVGERDRSEGQGRRALEIARHQEPAGRQGREGIDVVARPLEVGGEKFGDPPRRILAGVGLRGRGRRAP